VEFDFPENFFDTYEGRGSAAKEQEMEIVGHMRWGHDMKFENDPYTGKPTDFMGNINRMTEEQRAAWRASYNPRNEAFIREKPEGRELAKFMFHRYLRDYLKSVKSVDDGVERCWPIWKKKACLIIPSSFTLPTRDFTWASMAGLTSASCMSSR
jgi:hypothetical protein